MNRPILTLNRRKPDHGNVTHRSSQQQRVPSLMSGYRKTQSKRASMWLADQWPALFNVASSSQPLVLEIGIHRAIHRAYLQQPPHIKQQLSYRSVQAYLTHLTTGNVYLIACSDAHQYRYGLNGQPTTQVGSKHAQYARRKRQQLAQCSPSFKPKKSTTLLIGNGATSRLGELDTRD